MENKISVTVFEMGNGNCCGQGASADLGKSQHFEQLSRELNGHNISIKRVNGALEPKLLSLVTGIDDLILNKSTDIFPLTVVEGKIMKCSGYPTAAEITEWRNISDK